MLSKALTPPASWHWQKSHSPRTPTELQKLFVSNKLVSGSWLTLGARTGIDWWVCWLVAWLVGANWQTQVVGQKNPNIIGSKASKKHGIRPLRQNNNTKKGDEENRKRKQYLASVSCCCHSLPLPFSLLYFLTVLSCNQHVTSCRCSVFRNVARRQSSNLAVLECCCCHDTIDDVVASKEIFFIAAVSCFQQQ